MVLWDAPARIHNTSLVRLQGGVEKPFRAYGAVGFDGASGSARVAEGWARRGFTGITRKSAIRISRKIWRWYEPLAQP